jgi:hypothetical protein
MISKKKASWGLLSIIPIVVILFALLTALAHCATTSHKPNSTGSLPYTANPLMYMAVEKLQEVTNVNGNLNLRVNPLGTYLLYDESVLLCGLDTRKFDGVGKSFLLTYEREAHRSVKGVGCHNLLRVDKIVMKSGL